MEFTSSISPVGWLVILVLALAIWFGVKSRVGTSRLEEDVNRKQAKSASHTPPPGM